MHRKMDFKASRVYLLLIIPFTVLLQYTIPSFPINTENQTYTTIIEAVTIPVEKLPISADNNLDMFKILLVVYFLGAFISLLRVIIGSLIFIGIKKKSEEVYIKGVKVFVSEEICIPYTFWGNIFIPKKLEKLSFVDSILDHEKLHVKYLHSLDIVFMNFFKIVFWYNPFVWVMRKQLKEVHEYEVDESMISNSVEKQQYAQLLLDNAMGLRNHYFKGRLYYLNNSFSYVSLKQRINLIMKSKKLGVKRVYFAIPFICLLFLGVSINKANAVVSVDAKDLTSDTVKSTEKKQPVKEVSAFNKLEVRPMFGGGDPIKNFSKWVYSNITYPENAFKNNIQGKVLVKFLIDKEGNIRNVTAINDVDEELKAEAVNLIKKSPKWTPGKVDGKPVNVEYTFPVVFKLLENPQPVNPPWWLNNTSAKEGKK